MVCEKGHCGLVSEERCDCRSLFSSGSRRTGWREGASNAVKEAWKELGTDSTQVEPTTGKDACYFDGETQADMCSIKGLVPLPKSVTPKRIDDNANLYDFELSEDDLKSLDTGAYAPCCWDPTKEP